MKRFLGLVVVALFLFGCGGGSGSSSNTSSLEKDSLEAFKDSDWSDKIPATPDSDISVKIGQCVQSSVNSVTAEAITGIKATKSNKAFTYNQTVNGPLGGSALITGTYTYETTQDTVYPIHYTYDFKIIYDNYKDSSIAINGEINYTGTSDADSQSLIETEIEINGGYSVLYQDQVYNVVTKLEASISLTNQIFMNTNYTYTVNGQIFTGSF